jgi:hypothetical protein
MTDSLMAAARVLCLQGFMLPDQLQLTVLVMRSVITLSDLMTVGSLLEGAED